MQHRKEAEIDPVLTAYKRVATNVGRLYAGKYTRKGFDKKNKSNIPVEYIMMPRSFYPCFRFWTVRKNITHAFEITLRYYQGSERVIIHSFEKLLTDKEFQQKFDIFLDSGKHMFDFICDTVWPLFDEADRKKKENNFVGNTEW